jgi:hypothetical protein
LHIKKLENGEVICQFKVETEQKQTSGNDENLHKHMTEVKEYVPYWPITGHQGVIKFQNSKFKKNDNKEQ